MIIFNFCNIISEVVTIYFMMKVKWYFFSNLQVFRPKTPPEAINLCSRLLEYTPSTRLIPVESCAHCFFDELRDPNTKLPNGRELPPLFNFTPQGMTFLWCRKMQPTTTLFTAVSHCCGHLRKQRHCSFEGEKISLRTGISVLSLLKGFHLNCNGQQRQNVSILQSWVGFYI